MTNTVLKTEEFNVMKSQMVRMESDIARMKNRTEEFNTMKSQIVRMESQISCMQIRMDGKNRILAMYEGRRESRDRWVDGLIKYSAIFSLLIWFGIAMTAWMMALAW